VDGLIGYQRILFDHRGRGRSQKPTRVDDYAIERHVADIVALLDTLGLPLAIYWGYSGGASVGFALAAANRERIAAFIATGVIDDPDADADEARDETIAYAEAVRAGGMQYLVDGYTAEAPMLPWFRDQMLATDPNVFADSLLAGLAWPGPWPLLARIACSTLLLVGEREDPGGLNPRAAAEMPHARCVTFPGLNHIEAFERSDLALPHVLTFLRDLRLG
jgi:pimeloyl-ACP methyl ester carboxylesterase